MSEESWHLARLIPTSGINGAQEQERRATSAFLAVLGIVPEFVRSILGPLGAPSGRTTTYIEVPFELSGSTIYPDGLIRVRRGKRSWTALVEVKTGRNVLIGSQLENYLDIARREGFDSLITISNEIPSVMGQHPTDIDRRKSRNLQLHHVSWSLILSTAIMQKEHRGIRDPEQAWILGELIRYLEHEKSGALDFEDMGASWVAVRDAINAGTLRENHEGGLETVSRFDALVRYAGLRLGQRLGAEVLPLLHRHERRDPRARAEGQLRSLIDVGAISGSLRIPKVPAPVTMTADFRAGKIIGSAEIAAPQEGRQLTRVNWMLRQLKESPDELRIESVVARSRLSGPAGLLASVREDPKILIPERGKEIKSFRLAYMTKLGPKRGRGQSGFIDSFLDNLDVFYADVIQNVKPWTPAPPRVRKTPEIADDAGSLSSTALSSQDDEPCPNR